jgi:hypothetical protein
MRKLASNRCGNRIIKICWRVIVEWPDVWGDLEGRFLMEKYKSGKWTSTLPQHLHRKNNLNEKLFILTGKFIKNYLNIK